MRDTETSPSPPESSDADRIALQRRRAFVIHAFAGLSVATAPACARDASAASLQAIDIANTGPSGKRMGAPPRPAATSPARDAAGTADASVDAASDGSGSAGEDPMGLGSIGTIGRGHGGGTGYSGGGSRMGGRSPVAPTVRLHGPATVRGELDPAVIRRVIMRNIAQLRYCYERGFNNGPAPRGSITVHFVIGPTGAVTTAQATPEPASVRSVADCFATAFPRWLFPTPTNAAPVVATQIVDLLPTPPSP